MTLKQLANRKAALTRHRGADHPATLEATGALRYALLAQAITEATAVAPPLSDAEVAELTALLAGTGS